MDDDASNEDGQVAQPVLIDGRSMNILYGSETGNSQEIAEELGKMAQRLHFQTVVGEMDDFKLSDVLRASLTVFVVSTTGQGDMPKNSTIFWRNLRREKLNNTNCLGGVKFTVFGLGDSSYLKFNWAARKLRARLLQLGASEFFSAGEGDERHDNGIDSAYLPWCQDLRKTLLASYPLPDSVTPIPDDVQLPPKYLLRLSSAMASDDPNADSQALTEEDRRFLATRAQNAALTHVDHPRSLADQAKLDFQRLSCGGTVTCARQDDIWGRTNLPVDALDKDNILQDHPEKYLLKQLPQQAPPLPPADILPIPRTHRARVVMNERMTPPDHWQDVRSIFLDVDCPDNAFLHYAAGATVVIFPKNYPADVQTLIELMGWESVADLPLDLNQRPPPGSGHAHIPFSCPSRLYIAPGCATLRGLLTHNLDITAIPKRSFIRELIFFTRNPAERERLKELTGYGNEQEFYDYTSRPRRTIIELLQDFPGVKIPFERTLDLFSVIRGRDFSICNGGVGLMGGVKSEVGIQFLAALVEYKTVIRKPRQGLCSRYLKHLQMGTEIGVGFKYNPKSPLDPDHGAHMRPVIAVATGTGIAPIRALIQDRDIFAGHGPVLLFFGCRNEKADFFFRDEWEEDEGIEVIPAFSRDPVKPEGADTLNPYEDKALTAPKWQGGVGLGRRGPAGMGITGVDYDAGKNYVQHKIRKHAKRVGELLLRRPIICVCGNSGRMPVSVRQALSDVLIICKIADTIEAADMWLCDGRNVTYWQETW